jgi:deferrochelatase/peroxidase EfeB
MPGVADPTESDPDPAAPRGLLFMCYQRNVEHHFEFIQRTWVDNEHFPTGLTTLGILQKDTGDDPLIGQDPDVAQRWPKTWGDEDAGKKAFNFESAVTLKGGEYFFAPSIPFLRSL